MKNQITSLKQSPDPYCDVSEILSVADVAEYLGVGKNRIYELLQKGIIKGFRMGNTWKISRMALDIYIREASGL